MTFMSPNRLVSRPVIGLALDLVEQHRAAAIEMLLQAGEFEVGIDRLVGLDQVALGLQLFQRVAQADRPLDDLEIFFADCLLHGVRSRLCIA
jgi:hypothetical protein